MKSESEFDFATHRSTDSKGKKYSVLGPLSYITCRLCRCKKPPWRDKFVTVSWNVLVLYFLRL